MAAADSNGSNVKNVKSIVLAVLVEMESICIREEKDAWYCVVVDQDM